MRVLLLFIVMAVLAPVGAQAQPVAGDSFSQAAQQMLPDCAWLGGSAVLVAIGLLTFQNRRQRRREKQQYQQELGKEKLLEATEAVLKGEEHERIRLAKDLHDGLVGMLSGIKYSLHTIKEDLSATPQNQEAFERSMDMLDSSIKEMRRVAHDMMPEALIRFGLNTALRDFCKDVTQRGVLQISYQSIGMEAEIVDQTRAIAIYRIVQELVYNAVRHASATSAIVQITCMGNCLSLTVEDNGNGFDTSSLHDSKGLGWNNIGRRVGYLGGRCDITSRSGEGTSVHLELET
jgi:two-component system, NarL family, sensor kinase